MLKRVTSNHLLGGIVGIFSAALCLSSFPVFAETQPTPKIPLAKIRSIEGATTLTVQRAEGSQEAKAGSPLEAGDKIVTPLQTAAVLQYADGSTLIVSPDSELQVENQIDGTQWNRLKKGSVRGLISKPPTPLTKAKFLIRSRAAILGVRGTDFVMALNAVTRSAQIHTLEGSVEVAPNEEALLRGQSTVVGDGKFVDASPGKVEIPGSFNKKEFLDAFNANLPSGEGAGANVSSASTALDTGILPAGNSKSVGLKASGEPVGTHLPLKEEDLQSPQNLPLKSPPESKAPHVEDPADSTEARQFRPLSFRLGAFFTLLPDGTPIRAANVAWTPTLPVPFLSFLAIRGNFGLSFARDGSLSQGFVVREFQVFLNLTLFNTLFAEVGIGEQIWKSLTPLDGQLRSVNAGVLLPNGPIKCLFVGIQYVESNPIFNQYKVGLEISIM